MRPVAEHPRHPGGRVRVERLQIEQEVTLIFPPPMLAEDWLAQRKAQQQEQETGDHEDVTFTGPVFPRVSTSLPAPEDD